jgi:hypothetical protein
MTDLTIEAARIAAPPGAGIREPAWVHEVMKSYWWPDRRVGMATVEPGGPGGAVSAACRRWPEGLSMRPAVRLRRVGNRLASRVNLIDGSQRVRSMFSPECRGLVAMRRNRKPTAAEAVAILAAVARETKSYTDPRAEYPLAEKAREARLAGADRRRRRHLH